MKHILLFIAFLLSLGLISCSGNVPEEKIQNINSGSYKLSGIQVEIGYGFPWGDEENIYSRDTTHVDFTVKILYPDSKKDTVRFIGLEGANAGDHIAINSNCIHPSCFADANLSAEGELSFDLVAPSGRYSGRGFLGAKTLILETHFQYRGIGIDYHLQGEKVED